MVEEKTLQDYDENIGIAARESDDVSPMSNLAVRILKFPMVLSYVF